MSWDDRNRPCLCGKINPKTWNILKRKNCYSDPESENECLTFLIENKQKYITPTQIHLDSVIAEVSPIVKLLESNEDTIRSRFILVFSVLDTYSNFWEIFSGTKNMSDTQLWKEWVDLFIKNPLNLSYREWSDLCWSKDIDGSDFYDLRSSLSHFFGIWEKSQIVLITAFDKEFIKKLSEANSYGIDPQTLLLIVIQACKIMLDEINTRITTNNPKDLLNLKKLYLEVEKNWWKRVEITSQK